jgi:predicted RNA-binding Zn ribbon-like protein
MAELPSQLVRGLVLPRPVGGDVALDFCNTRAGRSGRGAARKDWLPSYQALGVWAGYSRLLPGQAVARLLDQAAAEPADAARRYEEAISFRTDLYDVLTDAAAASAFRSVAAVVERATARRRLVAVPAEPAPAEPEPAASWSGLAARWESPDDLGFPLDRIALLAGELLTDTRRASVRPCAGDDCGRLFLATHGRRRWCSMATCGNRAKARAHAARVRGAS